jgi:hypothetical protein
MIRHEATPEERAVEHPFPKEFFRTIFFVGPLPHSRIMF